MVPAQTVKETAENPVDITKIWEEFIADRSNEKLRNILIEHYLPLVRYHGERVLAKLPNEVELDDLVSTGIFGLMDAIDAYDMNRGVKFETYCVPRIRGAMLDELRNMDWVPRLVRSRSRKLAEANKELSDKLGRLPSQEELAKHLEMTPAELKRLVSDANTVNLVSLNKKWFETDGSKEISEIDLIEDQHSEDPASHIQKEDIMRLVTKGLSRNERLIIKNNRIVARYKTKNGRRDIGAFSYLYKSNGKMLEGYRDVPSAYYCRRDMKGEVYDRTAMFEASEALGHNRECIVAENYFWNM